MSMRVDSAYVDAQLLIQAQEQGITLVGPTRPDVSWQARADGAFDLTQARSRLATAQNPFSSRP
jgi:bifunctional ADP-heptose synthase (sugar kinase/adenylyltransferase)